MFKSIMSNRPHLWHALAHNTDNLPKSFHFRHITTVMANGSVALVILHLLLALALQILDALVLRLLTYRRRAYPRRHVVRLRFPHGWIHPWASRARWRWRPLCINSRSEWGNSSRRGAKGECRSRSTAYHLNGRGVKHAICAWYLLSLHDVLVLHDSMVEEEHGGC